VIIYILIEINLKCKK